MSYTESLVDHYAVVRSRLYGGSRPKPLPPPAAVIVAAPPPVVEEPQEDTTHHGVPLNMLVKPSWRFLLALASVKFGVAQREILSGPKFTNIVAARQYASALIYQHTQASVPQVAHYFDLNHTTVLYTLKKLGAKRKLVEVQSWTYAKLRTKSRDMISIAAGCAPA